MLRESNYNGIIKEYKNGNITLKIPKNEMIYFLKDPVCYIDNTFCELDCYFIGETFCLSNYETGHVIYNNYSDKIYVFPWRYIETLKEGKTIKLYAKTPDSDDRQYINDHFDN